MFCLMKIRGQEGILDGRHKSKDSIERHWTLDRQYMAEVGLEYISPEFKEIFNKLLSLQAM